MNSKIIADAFSEWLEEGDVKVVDESGNELDNAFIVANQTDLLRRIKERDIQVYGE